MRTSGYGQMILKEELSDKIQMILKKDDGRNLHLTIPKKSKNKELVSKTRRLKHLDEIEVECEVYGLDGNNKLVVTKLTKHE